MGIYAADYEWKCAGRRAADARRREPSPRSTACTGPPTLAPETDAGSRCHLQTTDKQAQCYAEHAVVICFQFPSMPRVYLQMAHVYAF